MRKPRPKEKTYIIGKANVEAAMDSGEAIEKILMLNQARSGHFKALEQKADKLEIPVKRVPNEKLDWLTQKKHEGIIAFKSLVNYQKLEDILSQVYENGELPFFVLLDGVTDVRNLGAISRSALCFGVHALVTPFRNSAEINHRTVETSAGALKELPVCRVPEIKDAVDYLKANGLSIFATTMSAETSVSDIDHKVPMAVVMGDEGQGVSKAILNLCDKEISIPMKGDFDSLNVSVAAGICLYEINQGRD